MKKNIVESWITTIIGVLIAMFGGMVFWYDKTPLLGCVVIWIVSAMFIFADEKAIKGLFDKISIVK